MTSSSEALRADKVVLPVPLEPLRELQRQWEHGDNFDPLEITMIIRDLFGGIDGHLTLIDQAIGCPEQAPPPRTFTEDQVNALVAQAHADGFTAGMAGQRMRDSAKRAPFGPPLDLGTRR